MKNFNIDGTIEIPSNTKQIGKIEKLIDNQATLCDLDDDMYGKMLLAVVEAVNNAIVHGNNEDSKKMVRIHYMLNNEFIMYSITDEGKGFDPNLVPDPTLEENLERDSGRGIYLMRSLCDEIEFADGGRTTVLKFNFE